MNPMATSAIGVDATDGVLKAVQLVRRGRRTTLTRAWRIPYFGAPDPTQGALDALAGWLRTARPGAGPRLVLAVPDQGHLSRTYVVPAMEADRIGELVRYEVLSELGLPDDELDIQHHVRKGVVEAQVHAFALRRAQIDRHVVALGERGVPFDELQPPGFALASFLEHEQPLGRDRVLLGVGQVATRLVLLREDGLWTRHIPLGLQHAETPAELAGRFADELSAATAWLLPPDRAFEPVDCVLSEDGAQDAAFTGALRAALGVPVTRVDGLRRVQLGRHAVQSERGAASVFSMGTAIGLALTGLGQARFPCPVRSGHAARTAARRLPVAAATLLVSAAGLFGVTELAEARADALAASLPPELAQEAVDLRRRADQLDDELQQQAEVVRALERLAACRPASFAVRTALARIAELATARDGRKLHVDQVFLRPERGGEAGLLRLTLHAEPSYDASLRQTLELSFAGSLGAVVVQGPEASPLPGISRWIVEITLP